MAAASGYWHWYGRVTTVIYAGLAGIAAALAVAAILSHVLTAR